MKVLKFGGSSVGSAKNILAVKDIIINAAKDEKLIIVFSAFGDVTDYLLDAGKQAQSKDEAYLESLKKIDNEHIQIINGLFDNTHKAHVISEVKEKMNHLDQILEGVFHLEEFSDRTYDMVLSFGERLSSYILAQYLKQEGLDIEWLDTRKIIVTENIFGGAKIKIKQTYKNIKALKLNSHITIFPGFIAANEKGETTTLGRGGSDYTAALIAGALKADELQVWKDVNGMLTADPRDVETAKTIPSLSYDEALELSHFGANVLYPPTVQPALINNIPIRIKNTLNPSHEGTLITNESLVTDHSPVRGLSSIKQIALVTISGSEMFGLPGFSKRFFETLSKKDINVMMITQGSSEHSITVAILPKDIDKALDGLTIEFENEIENKRLQKIQHEKNLSIIALVGNKMKNLPGVSGKMFGVLGKNGINVRAIAQGSSETNITAVISNSDLKKALNVLNESFFETEIKQLNLFVVGVGNVGKKFLQQLYNQKQYLLDERLLRINVVALANSKKMIFNESGIDLKDWEATLQNGETNNLVKFIDTVTHYNLRNSIFVDNSASAEVASLYESLLEKSIGIVCCNKIAASDEIERYKGLKKLSRDHNVPFLFETNVGAGLPIIDTLKSLVSSGDKIRKISAVLSGSLNFIFNNFKEGVPFYDVVKQAQTEGYTEPDPRIDLSGKDVMRKILILIREAGYMMNMDEIGNDPFLDESFFDGSVDNFFDLVKQKGDYFDQLRKKAETENCKLKFVATFDNGKASVGLQEIPTTHPFYDLQGKDNIVMLYTDRYPEYPMIIKGAGAGADVTASGVFADIIRFSTI